VDFQVLGYKYFKLDIWVIYIKAIRKYGQAVKATHTYFRLSESYRDKYGFPRQRMVLGLGRLPELRDFDQKVLFLQRLNELIHQLKIDNYLKSWGWDDEQINLAATPIISRAVYPASEYKTVSWIKEKSL